MEADCLILLVFMAMVLSIVKMIEADLKGP